MDGKIRVFTLENLLNSENAKQLVDTHYVDTSYGVLSGDYFNINSHEYIVAGQDDGSIQIYDYSANKQKQNT